MSMATQVPRPPRLTAAAAAAAAKRSLDPETCGSYDMTPIGVIMPHAPVYCLGASYNWKWFFTGGADGRVTKYDFPATVAGKAPLTQAQRSGMPDTATRSGHQLSFFYAEEAAATREYWRRVRGMPPIEPPPAPVAPVPAVAGAPGTGLGAAPNATVAAVPDSTTGGNDRPLTATMVPVRAADGSLRVSPVFSMAVHSQALFVAVGTRHGGIGLFTGRHDEGSQFACLSGGHTDVVSALALGSPAALGGEFAAEDRLISGSWDRSVVCWDLNTGQQISRIPAAATTDPTADAVVPPLIRSQVSALQWHPTDPNLVLVTQSAGQVSLLDMRVPPGSPAVEFGMPAKTPPWALSVYIHYD
ncbi:WD40-repeat-containing domain protein [Blastocladiella britannica]|nr:WD40-repeat-containing domain protein [Blastocladiella britannica]